jgi:hypothetical protein
MNVTTPGNLVVTFLVPQSWCVAVVAVRPR